MSKPPLEAPDKPHRKINSIVPKVPKIAVDDLLAIEMTPKLSAIMDSEPTSPDRPLTAGSRESEQIRNSISENLRPDSRTLTPSESKQKRPSSRASTTPLTIPTPMDEKSSISINMDSLKSSRLGSSFSKSDSEVDQDYEIQESESVKKVDVEEVLVEDVTGEEERMGAAAASGSGPGPGVDGSVFLTQVCV